MLCEWNHIVCDLLRLAFQYIAEFYLLVVENVCIYVHEGFWSLVFFFLFFCTIFVWC